MPLPKMMLVRQSFEAPLVEDIPLTVREELAGLDLASKIKPGETVAVTVGSRGIRNLPLIVRSLIRELKSLGAEPFVVPAMGSHGGGTAQGQRAIVEGYGVTEDYIGAPIRATMEVVLVGRTEDGIPVYFDKYAYEADHVAVVNRVKPHTSFTGEIESGLHKMMLIGLGKHKGARLYHQAIVNHSFGRIIDTVARTVIEKCGILLGLAVVENQNDRTALIRGVAPEEFAAREKELFVKARQWLPRLPFDKADLLIVDKIGKNFSGTGLDTNVVGRKFNNHRAVEDEYPKITRIFTRDLSDESHGNATGLGIGEYTHKRLVDKVDWEVTYTNCLTGNHPSAASVPLHYDTDRKVIETALTTVGLVEPVRARILRIRNTLDLAELLVSEAYLEEVEERKDLTVAGPLEEMAFDGRGDLPGF